MLTVQEYLKLSKVVLDLGPRIKLEMLLVRPRIYCHDGFNLSVQASEVTYATPRSNTGPYTAVEVGFPSHRPPAAWEQYTEDPWFQLNFTGWLKQLWCHRHAIWYNLKHITTRGWHLNLLRKYLSFGDTATSTVYPYIPIELVEEAVTQHGGIDIAQTKRMSILQYHSQPSHTKESLHPKDFWDKFENYKE